MCERCDAWEMVIDNWFGECLLQTLKLYVDQCLEEMNASASEGHVTSDPAESRTREKLACVLLASTGSNQR